VSDDFDAGEAAAIATGRSSSTTTSSSGASSDAGDDGVAPDHAAAEGAPDESSLKASTVSSMRSALASTEPSPPLSQVESPWNPEDGKLARIYRGIQKATGVDGLPAILDIGIGAIETLHAYQDGFRVDDVEDEQDGAEDEGDAPEAPGGVTGV